MTFNPLHLPPNSLPLCLYFTSYSRLLNACINALLSHSLIYTIFRFRFQRFTEATVCNIYVKVYLISSCLCCVVCVVPVSTLHLTNHVPVVS